MIMYRGAVVIHAQHLIESAWKIKVTLARSTLWQMPYVVLIFGCCICQRQCWSREMNTKKLLFYRRKACVNDHSNSLPQTDIKCCRQSTHTAVDLRYWYSKWSALQYCQYCMISVTARPYCAWNAANGCQYMIEGASRWSWTVSKTVLIYTRGLQTCRESGFTSRGTARP